MKIVRPRCERPGPEGRPCRGVRRDGGRRLTGFPGQSEPTFSSGHQCAARSIFAILLSAIDEPVICLQAERNEMPSLAAPAGNSYRARDCNHSRRHPECLAIAFPPGNSSRENKLPSDFAPIQRVLAIVCWRLAAALWSTPRLPIIRRECWGCPASRPFRPCLWVRSAGSLRRRSVTICHRSSGRVIDAKALS